MASPRLPRRWPSPRWKIEKWQNEGYTDIRVNQQRNNAAGKRVGINRPDLQGTSPAGQREHIEWDRSTSTRRKEHESRILATILIARSSSER
jgi:hypothetical protein